MPLILAICTSRTLANALVLQNVTGRWCVFRFLIHWFSWHCEARACAGTWAFWPPTPTTPPLRWILHLLGLGFGGKGVKTYSFALSWHVWTRRMVSVTWWWNDVSFSVALFLARVFLFIRPTSNVWAYPGFNTRLFAWSTPVDVMVQTSPRLITLWCFISFFF